MPVMSALPVERGPSLVFVDWAGDAGFQFRRGSSPFLVVAAIFTWQYHDLQQTLSRFREEMALRPDYEFHFTNTVPGLRLAFRRALVELPVTARVIVLDKERLAANRRQISGGQLIGWIVAEAVVGADREMVEGAALLVDGRRGDTKTVAGLRAEISSLCRERKLPYPLSKIRVRPAADEPGLQVADMVAGMTMREAGGGEQWHLARMRERMEVLHLPETENRPG